MAEPGLRELFEGYLAGHTSDAETQQLFERIAKGIDDQELNAWVAAYWEQLDKADPRFTSVTGSPLLHRILGTSSLPKENKGIRRIHRVRFLKTAWFRYAAASIILALGIGAYFWKSNRKNTQPATAETRSVDIAPGSDGAILTLADGSQVVLDSLGNGIIANQNGSKVVLENSQLAYDLTRDSTKEVVYNTMTTPKGRQFQVILSDGTKVWLNAASSIRYPTVFMGKERGVTVTGEVYFEVARDKQKPFVVNVNGRQSVEVLGTKFNVNAYQDEPGINTTLLEGSIAVSSARQSKDDETVVLKPGQQAEMTNALTGQKTQSVIKIVNEADIEKVIAWKNRMFIFASTDIHAIMRQISRWYNVDIVFNGNIDEHFTFETSRDVSLNNLLENLSLVGKLNFKTEGRIVTVSK